MWCTCECVCILTGRPGGGAVILFRSRDVASQRFSRPREGRPLLRAAVCSLLRESRHWRVTRAPFLCMDSGYLSINPSFTFSTRLSIIGEHAEEGRGSLSPSRTRGLRLRLQAEPARGGMLLDAPRWNAIFNRTALVGLWTPKPRQEAGSMHVRKRGHTDGEMKGDTLEETGMFLQKTWNTMRFSDRGRKRWNREHQIVKPAPLQS